MSIFPSSIAPSCAFVIALCASTALAYSQSVTNEQGEIIVVVPNQPDGSDLRGDDTEHASAEQGLGESAFATVVRVRDSEGERRSVSEVLARTVGVSSASMGGLGAFSSISVRGADAGHTMVSVDGVPLSRLASVTANLGQFDLSSFEKLELYRGGVPARLGGAGVGGAVYLQTAVGPGGDGKALQFAAGLGSFGARHLRGQWLGGERKGKRAYHLSAGYEHANGDFDFFDDGATALNRGDDRTARRVNNAYDRMLLVGRARLGKWTLGSRSSVQEQGLPGAAHDQALQTGLHTVQEIADAGYQNDGLAGAKSHLSAKSFVSVERQRFSDPQSEIGLLAQDSVYLTTSAGLGSGFSLPAGSHQILRIDLDSRMDWFRETPKGSPTPGAVGNRQGVGLSFSDQISLAGDRWVVDLGLRADAWRTKPGTDVFSAMSGGSEPVQRDWYVSPRVTTRYALAPSIAIKGSGGRYLRMPTLLEMFGDRGFVLGNSELRAETGLSSDLGLVWAPWNASGAVDRIYVEAVAFATRPQHPIVLVNRNGLAAQAINLEGARILGSELVLSMRAFRRVTLTANYSHLSAQNQSEGAQMDKQLPGRPAQRLYGRVDVALNPRGHLLVLWLDALRLSGNFVDELNVFELPARQLVGVGTKVAITSDLLVGLEMKNALDLRSELVALDPPPSEEFTMTRRALSDVHGYPLPGRSLYLTLQWSP